MITNTAQENVSCGWGCKFSGTIAQVAKHIKDTHPVKLAVEQIEWSLRHNLEALARPVKARRA